MRARCGIGAWGLLPLACTVFFSSGCRSRPDLLEAELRSKDRDLYEMRDELYRTSAFNEALRRQLCALRGGTNITPEAAAQLFNITTVTLGRQTGGYDADGGGGDQALQVVLEPKDPDGHTIKAPGGVEVSALQITREGLKTPLSSWAISPDELRRSWRSGLLSTGYSLILPWKVWPISEKLRVIVHFKLEDGRIFEADKDVTVRLAPQYRKRMPTADGVEPQPEAIPAPAEFPPPPRKWEGPLPPDGWNDMPLSRAGGPQWHQAAASPFSGAAEMLRPIPAK
jgi:hypothetical protein